MNKKDNKKSTCRLCGLSVEGKKNRLEAGDIICEHWVCNNCIYGIVDIYGTRAND